MRAMVLTWSTLKKRSEFLRVRGGASWGTPAFLLQVRVREESVELAGADANEPRFGFTVTKKMGNAVMRNRMRRRLKAAVDDGVGNALPGRDYVVVARRGAALRAFKDIASDLAQAFDRVHSPRANSGRGNAKKRRR